MHSSNEHWETEGRGERGRVKSHKTKEKREKTMRESVTRTGEKEKSFGRKDTGTQTRRATIKPGVERGIKREKRGRKEKGRLR